MINVALVEDNGHIAQVLKQSIEHGQYAHVMAHFRNGLEIVHAVQKGLKPDVILMDINMPVMNGIEATEKIIKNFPDMRIVMCTVFDDDDNIFNAILAGAKGYILKDENSQNIQSVLDTTLSGGSSLSPAIALKAINLIKNGKTINPNEDFGLTPREMEILQAIAGAAHTDRVAQNLKISIATLRKHSENIYRKLGVNSRIEAVLTAQKNKLI